ncbi:MAG: hypothetical protein ACFB14_07340 [Leptolyngbyaceae cyanobacterium]
MGRDRIIEAYIQRLLAWEKPITRATLTRIAEEVGITSGELEAISIQAKAHFTRGRGYIEFGCLDDAINELNQAVALEPVNLEILQALANVYGLRYNRTRERVDKQTALFIAKRCIELKPDAKEAMVLISFLEHTPAKGKQQASKWTQQKIAALAGGVATLSIGLLGVSRLPVFSKPSAPLGPAPGTMIPGAAVLYEPGQSVEPDSGIEIDFVSDVDIPVIFDHPGLMLEARVSELGDYENEVYYRLQGVFINASDQEFSKLTLNVEFLDRNDLAIAATAKDAVADTDAVIRPGDTHTFNLLQRVTPDLATIRLSITNLEQSLARSTYVPPTPINYGWATPEPDGIRFDLTSRSEKATQDSEFADNAINPSFNAEWVIINTSDLPIHELKLKADFYDDNEQLLQTEDVFAINTNDAALLPGETRPFRVIAPVVSDYERYKVSVAKIE